jgi:hypothetical protein
LLCSWCTIQMALLRARPEGYSCWFRCLTRYQFLVGLFGWPKLGF